eukprot:1438047-Ditylum_brightwellii.AAC.1
MLNIQQHQFQDLPLNAMQRQYPQQYLERPHDPAGDWKIALPTALGLIGCVIQYRHISKLLVLQESCDAFKCADCQCNVQLEAGYGELLAWMTPLLPWEDVAVNSKMAAHMAHHFENVWLS